ncbi:hypothetical protein MMP71_01075 [Acinetobacter dispersus]|uniref:hypothetical protein n=1 Tax=Acinetobacter dispersus TaxID=70348 RepID=UPI001F4B0BA8|nr:hypothetical protein [Acinetobacter dispersus]MCH7382434.1 hypothetical protein [Acinetobacter dispersus]
MIRKEAFYHPSKHMILIVFLFGLLALIVDLIEKNKHLENYMGILSTFVSTSSIFWYVVFLGFIIFFIPLIFLAKIDERHKKYFFKHSIVPKLYKLLENCPLIIVNTINALVGCLLALAVFMLFSENPLANSLTFIFIAVLTYIFAILQLSMLIDIKCKINFRRKYF